MFYAIKSFLSEVTVVLLDEDKQPFTFYTIRAEDINLGDLYVAQITEKMQEQKAFFATIGDGRDVYLASKQPLEIGQRITVVITKEARLGKIPQAKRHGNVMPPKTPLGLVQKGDILIGINDVENYQQIDWDETFDDFILEASEMYVPFAKGAQLIFERTHAFYSIDVDSHTSTEPFESLNKQAAVLIAKEIIKRNMSGNILIDFIGQKTKNEINALKNIMSRELCKSPVPYQLMGVSPMGNVELRRQRMRSGIDDTSRTLTSLAYRLFAEIIKEPANIKKVNVSLSLYGHLTTLLQKTWKQVEAKTGDKIPLVANTQLTTYKIEYK